MIQVARLMCLHDGSYRTRAVGFWPWKQHEKEKRWVKQNELRTVSNRNDKHTDIGVTTINDLLTFLRRFRGHVYFRFSAVPYEPARIIAGRYFIYDYYQTLLQFYPEFPLFIRSSASGTLLSRHSSSSLEPLLVKLSDFHVGVCMILIIDQLIFNKEKNVTETGKHRCSTVCSMILYTGKFFSLWMLWMNTQIYACQILSFTQFFNYVAAW